MNLQEILKRIAEINEKEIPGAADQETIDKLVEERKELLEKKEQLETLETRKQQALAIQNGQVAARALAPATQEVEIRNSKAYIDAYAEYIKTGDDKECRALLSTNVTDGTVAVPQIVTDEIKTAWESNSILRLITNKFEAAGNIAQQFEISGDDAQIHTEGSGAVSEENLSLGIATLVPDEIIKWISFSKTVMAMRGEAFIRYIYRELSHKIMRALLKKLIQQIVALPETANSTTPSAAKVKLAATVGTVATAFANLCDEAENPVVVINKLTHATMKAAAYANGYYVDPFEGLDVHYNDTLPAYTAASENDTWMIVGDFGYGVIANFPNGDTADVTLDTLTKKKAGMVEACGDVLAGAIPCACKAFTRVTKPAVI